MAFFARALRVGGNVNNGANCGAWYWNANNAASNGNWNLCGRLLYCIVYLKIIAPYNPYRMVKIMPMELD